MAELKKKLENDLANVPSTAVAYVWWDYDCAALPEGVKTDKAVKKLQELAAAKKGKRITIELFTNNQNLNLARKSQFYDNNVDVTEIVRASVQKSGRSEEVDKRIISKMSKAQPGDLCILLTGDAGFQRYMVDLANKGCTIILIYPLQAMNDFAFNAFWAETHSFEKFFDFTPDMYARARLEKDICKHFSENICQFDDNCKFIHICSICKSKDHGAVKCPENTNKPPTCTHFNKGNCKFGPKCNLDHDCLKCGIHGEYRCPNGCRPLKPQSLEPQNERQKPGLLIPPAVVPFNDPKKQGKLDSENREPPLAKVIENKRCEDSFFCERGLKCPFFHLPPELTLFNRKGGKGVAKRCIEECRQGENCRRKGCKFAHNQSEFVCFYCGDEGKHLARNCPEQAEYQKNQKIKEKNTIYTAKTPLPEKIQQSNAVARDKTNAVAKDKTNVVEKKTAKETQQNANNSTPIEENGRQLGEKEKQYIAEIDRLRKENTMQKELLQSAREQIKQFKIIIAKQEQTIENLEMLHSYPGSEKSENELSKDKDIEAVSEQMSSQEILSPQLHFAYGAGEGNFSSNAAKASQAAKTSKVSHAAKTSKAIKRV